MILLLDIGNTRIKWGFLREGQLQAGGALLRGEGDVAAVIAAVQLEQSSPARVVISNVAATEYNDLLCHQVAASWGCEVERVAAQAAAFGVINGYDEPQQLGVDRWLALVAARNMVGGALCVIDCGTALTVDLVNSSGAHLGGMIVPGMALMQAALIDNTEGLRVASEWQAKDELLFLARNTTDAILGGAHYALIALIDRVASDAQVALGEAAEVVLSGGDAAVLRKHLQCETLFEPDLVLKGLAVVAGADQR